MCGTMTAAARSRRRATTRQLSATKERGLGFLFLGFLFFHLLGIYRYWIFLFFFNVFYQGLKQMEVLVSIQIRPSRVHHVDGNTKMDGFLLVSNVFLQVQPNIPPCLETPTCMFNLRPELPSGLLRLAIFWPTACVACELLRKSTCTPRPYSRTGHGGGGLRQGPPLQNSELWLCTAHSAVTQPVAPSPIR